MSRFEEVVEVAKAAMEDLSVPGVALGVLFEGEEELAGLGVTSVEHPLEVTPDTLFQVGSITKTFTATAIMRLVEDGKIGLDDSVRAHLPSFRLADEEVAERATIRQLLTHTGGWLGDYFDDLGPGEEALARMVERLAEQPQLTSLGEVYSYNNAAFYVAGRVIEVATGQPFETAIRELVLAPLGLEAASFFADDVITHRFAVGHEKDEAGETVVARPWSIGRAAHPAGGLVMSTRDLMRYARFWIEGGDLLRPESVEEMLRPQVPIGGNVDAVGLAWMLMSIEGVRLIGHSGGTKGQVTFLGMAPEQGLALVVFTNHSYGGVLTERVAAKAYEAYLGVREPELEAVELDAAPYLGRYSSRMADLELVEAEAGLELRYLPKGGFPTPDTPPPPPPPPASVRFASEDELFCVDEIWKGERILFLRDPEGRIKWLRAGGRVYSPAG
ncbi:MAG: beta-lactamase family protein [Actinobacteria bacterium]|nr:beta-lactamase family protein [Actinomycetota bacterium]